MITCGHLHVTFGDARRDRHSEPTSTPKVDSQFDETRIRWYGTGFDVSLQTCTKKSVVCSTKRRGAASLGKKIHVDSMVKSD